MFEWKFELIGHLLSARYWKLKIRSIYRVRLATPADVIFRVNNFINMFSESDKKHDEFPYNDGEAKAKHFLNDD